MKLNRISVLGIVLALFVGIAACAPKVTETQPASVPATEGVVTAIVETREATPAIDVETLIIEKLENNHSIDRVYAANKTREEWNTTLDRMIGYGAKISEEEKQIIIDFLLSRNK